MADTEINTFYVGMNRKLRSTTCPDDGSCLNSETRNIVSATGVPPEGTAEKLQRRCFYHECSGKGSAEQEQVAKA